jgi:DNA-binding Xre family transcriptional regulator
MAVRNKLLERIQQKERELGRRLQIVEVERQSGVTRATLYNWLNNSHQGTYHSEVITRLCAYFECELSDLLVVEPDTKAS